MVPYFLLNLHLAEKIYQTLNTVFYKISMHLIKISLLRVVFSTFLLVFGNVVKPCPLMCDVVLLCKKQLLLTIIKLQFNQSPI